MAASPSRCSGGDAWGEGREVGGVEGRLAGSACPATSDSLPTLLLCTAAAPRQVKILTNHLPCGQEVSIDLEAAARKAEIKAKLQEATGVPAAHQKLLLSGINQIVMGDKRGVGGGGR